MKFAGDVSQEDRELIFQIKDLEKWADQNDKLAADLKAKIYTCLAHDFYDIEFEDEGHALLLKAESVYPHYFRDKMPDHMREDEMYKKVVVRMSIKLGGLLRDVFKTGGKL